MKVIFMGTPDFSVATLEAIINAGHDVVTVVTQPDKPKGRSGELQMSPVKEAALAHNIEVLQPVKVRVPEVVEQLRSYNADVIVVVAFGQILPQVILDMTPYGCVNVHASLLPKYRGAAPIQWAVIDGEKESGVTTMQMDAGIDTGDMLMVEKYTLAADETGGSLFDRLAVLGGSLLVKTLDGLANGTVKPVPQKGESSYASKLEKKTGNIDWNMPAVKIERLVRGLNPWPCAYTKFNNKTLKIWNSSIDDTKCTDITPGTIYRIDKEGIYVGTSDKGLIIRELQLEGKKRMDTASFLRGCTVEVNTILG